MDVLNCFVLKDSRKDQRVRSSKSEAGHGVYVSCSWTALHHSSDNMIGDYEMDRNLKDLRLFNHCDLFNELRPLSAVSASQNSRRYISVRLTFFSCSLENIQQPFHFVYPSTIIFFFYSFYSPKSSFIFLLFFIHSTFG